MQNLILPENLAMHFQPIVSLKQKSVVGLEALARPLGMSVAEFFQQATDLGQLLGIDRLCRQRALQAYAALASEPGARPLLFMNIEVSVITETTINSGAVEAAVMAQGLRPQDVVIEINESMVTDMRPLKRFVEHHKNLGFTIALDDLGAGHSNLPRIADLKPHILKVDRGLLTDIDKDFYKQETFKSLASLGHRIGALVLAEGVETQEEVDICAALGADLFQGFFFARPQAPKDLSIPSLKPRLHEAAERHRHKAIHQLQERRTEGKRLNRVAEAGRNVMAHSEPIVFPAVLSRLLRGDLSIESAYLLDKEGMQATWMITSSTAAQNQSILFSPTPKGADHSSKEYFYSLIDTGLERFITETHLSLTTGKPCRTLSTIVHHQSGDPFILCLELAQEY